MSDAGSTGSDRHSLLGNVYRGTEDKRPVRPFVVIMDRGGDSVLVENVEPPHATRQILRRRLATYHYELIGRQEKPGEQIHEFLPPPVFDGPAFASWLRRYMQAEGLQVEGLAARAGISAGMIHAMRRGLPTGSQMARGQTALSPSINTIAAIAHGLGLQFSYVAEKAGFHDRGGRWANFSQDERTALVIALDGETDADDLDTLLTKATGPKEAVS